MKNWLISKMLKSKKFWYAIGSIVIPLIVKFLGISADIAQEIFYAGVALIIGQGLADSGKVK